MINSPFFSPLNWTLPRAGQLPSAGTNAGRNSTRKALLALTFATTLLAGCNDKKNAGTTTGAAPTDQSGEHEGDDDQSPGMMGGREGHANGEMDTTHRGRMRHGMGKGQKRMGL